MHTPTSSSSQSRVSSMQTMLQQLDRKINQISELKGMISQAMFSQELQQSATRPQRKVVAKEQLLYGLINELKKEYGSGFRDAIRSSLEQFNNQNMESMVNLINFYEGEIKKCKHYYEAEVWDLREEIKRQYKVIAMMKQEVEDLMVLMKYKENVDTHEQDQEGEDMAEEKRSEDGMKAESKGNKLKLNTQEVRQYAGDLEVIDEETQRTLQSSQRSHGNSNEQERASNFIKIEQKEEQNEQKVQKDDSQDLEQWKTELSMKEKPEEVHQNYQSSDHHDYNDFNQNLTPKQPQKFSNPKIEVPAGPTQNKVFPSPNNSLEQLSIQQRRKNKTHTAPSDDRKVDHLQSIFFLDDEPQEYLNKTAKMKSYGEKLQFLDPHCDQSNSVKLLRRSQLSAEDQYCPAQEINYHKASHCHGRAAEMFRQSSCFDQKKAKTNRIMTQEETSEYVNRKFNKIPIDEFQSSASVPVSSSSGPLNQLSPNLDSDTGDRKSIQSKPKTKQFLEQFRKTFNKCLKSMQVSKKNSAKVAGSSHSHQKQEGKNPPSYECQPSQFTPGVMTFGKSNPTSNYSSISQKEPDYSFKENQRHDDDHSSTSSKNTMKAVDHMLKELQNTNKFTIGNKKLELKYEGEKRNGIRNGNGVLFYSNGLCYEGEFKDGYRHGYGILKFNHIEIYNGDWVHDEIEGQGKIRNCAIINKRKTVYSGQTPLGKWISYSGEFKSSKFQGQGTLYLQGGEKFVGHFQNGYACGQGFIYKKNGEVEHGQWKNNFAIDSTKEKQTL